MNHFQNHIRFEMQRSNSYKCIHANANTPAKTYISGHIKRNIQLRYWLHITKTSKGTKLEEEKKPSETKN